MIISAPILMSLIFKNLQSNLLLECTYELEEEVCDDEGDYTDFCGCVVGDGFYSI